MITMPQVDVKCRTNPAEFEKFNSALMRNAPILFEPFYFLCEKQSKEPAPGISWKKGRLSFTQAYDLMKKGYNIGIAGMEEDDLCIMDVDDLEQVPYNEIKPTLTVISRKRIGRHYYYFSPDWSAKKNIATGDAGEIRARGQYVLTPGSFVPCGDIEISRICASERQYAGMYTVAVAATPADITFNELPKVYKFRYYDNLRTQAEAARKAVERKGRKVPKILKYESKMWDLSLSDVAGIHYSGSRNVPVPSFMHGSETGHNCRVGRNILHCWRHDVTHNYFSLLAVKAGLMSCEQAGKPTGGAFGVDFYDGRTIFECWKYAKDTGLIPRDDPVPHAGLVYYALSRGICEKHEIEEDGRLPAFFYAISPLVAQREGIDLGRQ